MDIITVVMRDVTIVNTCSAADPDAAAAVRRSGRVRRVLCSVFGLLVAAQIALALTGDSSPVARVSMLAIDWAMALLLIRHYWITRRFAQHLKGLGTPYLLTFAPSGIRVAGSDDLLLRWSALARLVETPAFFVFVTELGSGFAVARRAPAPART